MALLGLFSFLFLSSAAFFLLHPYHTKIVYSISHAGRKIQRKKGDHKTSFGHGRISNKFEKGIASIVISSLLLLPFWGPRLCFYLDRGDLAGRFRLALACFSIGLGD
jgi:hypothetical protein